MSATLVLIGVVVGVALTNLWHFVTRRHPLDALTGVPTRHAVHDALRDLRAGDAVVMLDLDELKAVNDAHGHGAGDDRLRALAAHLTRGVRAGDTVARWGGDEFVIVLRTGGASANAVVERLRATSPVSFSAGVAAHRDGPGDATLAKADEALLAAKRAGGALVVEAEG